MYMWGGMDFFVCLLFASRRCFTLWWLSGGVFFFVVVNKRTEGVCALFSEGTERRTEPDEQASST